MAKVFIEETTLTAIGDAIRNKTGKADLIDPALMSTEIASIEAGGGSDLPEEAFTITGDCSYRFAHNGWNWFVENYGDKVKTEGITNLAYAFYGTGQLTEIPFVINVSNASIDTAFNNMFYLTKCPKIRGTLSGGDTDWFKARSVIAGCRSLRDVEDLITADMIDHVQNVKVTSASGGGYQIKFYDCCSLRQLPSWFYLQKLSPESTAIPNSSIAGLYKECFFSCHSLDEILDIPVWAGQGTATSNMFSSTFSGNFRVKDITFETDNGQPIVAKWKTQTIDLCGSSNSYTVGYCGAIYDYIIDYNSGITTATKVTDDATYQALKNDPDWYTLDIAYSRYNHDSAVNTINSLPDTSAYLASVSGTNTIKFKGAAGSKTDGGAINTLTAEEIAVAAAKGWTVTLV